MIMIFKAKTTFEYHGTNSTPPRPSLTLSHVTNLIAAMWDSDLQSSLDLTVVFLHGHSMPVNNP